MARYAQIIDIDTLMAVELNQKSGGDNTILENALDRASREIDSYIATRYGIPIANPSLELIDYCITIARYWLFSRTGSLDKDDVVNQDYLRTLGRLAEVQQGKKDLVGVVLKENHPEDGLIAMVSTPRLFGRSG